MVYDSLKGNFSLLYDKGICLSFSIYLAGSNKMSLSSYAIKLLWPCASVNIGTCPSSIFLLLSSSLFFWTRIHEHDDSLYLFSFCFMGMTSFCMIDHDGQWLMSCTCMIKVRNVHSITWEAIGLNELKMYKIAMWNHRNYSHVYMWNWWCLSIRELPWFCFWK